MLDGEFPSNFELVVMLSILDLRGKAYGVNLRQKIEAETELEVTYGTLYAALDRLEEKGWLRSVPGQASAHRDRKPVQIYHFTVEGLKRFGKAGVAVQPLIEREGVYDCR